MLCIAGVEVDGGWRQSKTTHAAGCRVSAVEVENTVEASSVGALCNALYELGLASAPSQNSLNQAIPSSIPVVTSTPAVPAPAQQHLVLQCLYFRSTSTPNMHK